MLMKHEGDYGFHLHHQQAIAIHGHRRTHWGTIIKLYPFNYFMIMISFSERKYIPWGAIACEKLQMLIGKYISR